MLYTKNLSFAYPKQPYTFQFPDLQLAAGDSLLIKGSSGVGKTTLLHLLGGLLKPDTGQLEIYGRNLLSMAPRQLDAFRGQHIGFVFQKSYFFPALSVRDNLSAATYFSGTKSKAPDLEALSTNLGIGHLLDKNVRTISVGEQQRVSIARALINRPKLILADEPTSSLDDQNCRSVLNLITQQARNMHATLIIITHDQRLSEFIQNQITLT